MFMKFVVEDIRAVSRVYRVVLCDAGRSWLIVGVCGAACRQG